MPIAAAAASSLLSSFSRALPQQYCGQVIFPPPFSPLFCLSRPIRFSLFLVQVHRLKCTTDKFIWSLLSSHPENMLPFISSFLFYFFLLPFLITQNDYVVSQIRRVRLLHRWRVLAARNRLKRGRKLIMSGLMMLIIVVSNNPFLERRAGEQCNFLRLEIKKGKILLKGLNEINPLEA